jgi:hypothetical protein
MDNLIMSTKSAFSVITAIILIGCATEEDKIRKAVEEYQALNLNDFSSYEFVSLSLDSAITHAHNISWRLAKIEEQLEYWKESLKFNERHHRDLKSIDPQLSRVVWEPLIQQTKNRIHELNRFSAQMDSFRLALGDQANSTACEVYDYSFRETNELGAKVLRKTKLYITPELKVEWIALDGDSRLLACNELPAFLEILKVRETL